MPTLNDKPTIISMAIIASALATLLHEGLGHGITAWLRGDIPTELTSNHLSSLQPDRWVDAAGTLVNLAVGAACLLIARRTISANTRYFFWILAALNLLPGAGYFLFSGIFGFGDWNEVIRGLPHQPAVRIGMTLFGAALYVWFVRLLAQVIRPFVPERHTYNTVGRLPYYTAPPACSGPTRSSRAHHQRRKKSSRCIARQSGGSLQFCWEVVTYSSWAAAFNSPTDQRRTAVAVAGGPSFRLLQGWGLCRCGCRS